MLCLCILLDFGICTQFIAIVDKYWQKETNESCLTRNIIAVATVLDPNIHKALLLFNFSLHIKLLICLKVSIVHLFMFGACLLDLHDCVLIFNP